MIVDFHCHVFPDKIAAKAVAGLEKSGGQTAVLDVTVSGLAASMRRAGVGCSVILPIATKPGQVVSINDFAMAQHRKNGILAFGSMHPDYEDWAGELARIRAAGLLGVKLHPDFQGVFVDDPKMVAVMKEAGRLGLMVLLHGGYDVSFPDVHRSTPRRLASILPELSGTTVIAAHLGGYGYLDDVEQLLVGKDLYFDTSFVIGKFDPDQIKRILTAHPAGRLLFGTDSPWDGQAEAVRSLRALGLPGPLERRILGENAADLLAAHGIALPIHEERCC